MSVNKKADQQNSNTKSKRSERQHQWVLAIGTFLFLTVWLIFFLTSFWKMPSFLLRLLYIFVIPAFILIRVMWEGMARKLEQQKEGRFIPLFTTITLWVWIIFSLLVWELPKHVGIVITIENLLLFSTILVPGFGAGLLIRKGMKNIQDHSFDSWLIPDGLFFLAGSLLFSLCFPIVFWLTAMFATG